MSKGFTHESTYNESKEWYTPRYIFQKLGVDFDLDPCSPGQDIVPWIPAQIHYTYLDNGLTEKWFGNCFVNPPYGSDTPKWMERLARHGNGIALVFSRCDTRWFHDYAPFADAICFIKGRVQFVPADKADFYADGQYRPTGGCGAGSMLMAFGEDNARALHNSGLGFTVPVAGGAAKDLFSSRTTKAQFFYEGELVAETIDIDDATEIAKNLINEGFSRDTESVYGIRIGEDCDKPNLQE